MIGSQPSFSKYSNGCRPFFFMIKNHKKIKPVVFRDPVFGDIPVLSKVIIEVINTPEMQRLRQIKQLSGGHYVFPGATHNRFSHCLGVFYVMSFFLKNPFFNLGTILSTKEQQKLQLAALLHDVGHGPFSHVFEHVYRMQGLDTKHEDYSLLLITNHKSQIYQTLKRHRFTSQDIQDIGNYISNNHSSVLGNLISSQIDADRIDYLMRDNLYTGVGYGYTDLEFLVRN